MLLKISFLLPHLFCNVEFEFSWFHNTKQSSRRLGRPKIVTLKTCWRRIQDMSWRRLQEVFKTNKCFLRTNVQTRCPWKSWLANLRNFEEADTFCASFHRNTVFTFAPEFVTSSTIHTICGYIIAAGQITHRIPAISNWNFWFCRFKSVWLQTGFFEVSHSFDLWLRARQRQRFAGGHFAKSADQKIELDFIAFSVVIKFIPTRHHEIF